MDIPLLTSDEYPRPVGVITGGWSLERDRSLLSGQAVAESLGRQGIRFTVIDLEDEALLPKLSAISVAFLAIAGRGAEDGQLQGMLDTLGIENTGSGTLASGLGMHKPTAKVVVAAAGVPVADGLIVDSARPLSVEERRLVDDLGWPLVVKPTNEGGSIGIRTPHTMEQLVDVVSVADDQGVELMIERLCHGVAVSVGVLEMAGDVLRALPPLEIAAPGGVYSYEAKRGLSACDYHCPARLPAAVVDAVQAAARTAHRALGCHGYSRHDFVVGEDGAMVWLEVNTLPGLTRTGNLARMAAAAGLGYDQLIAHILRGARTGGPRRRALLPAVNAGGER